jgi:hypothetical protein
MHFGRNKDTGKTIELMQNPHPDTAVFSFGKYLGSLDTDGIIALSFLNAGLPFYYDMSEGIDIISDVIIEEQPIPPPYKPATICMHSKQEII